MQALLFLKAMIVLSVAATILWTHGKPAAARQVAKAAQRDMDR
jgi:hypothetical protein